MKIIIDVDNKVAKLSAETEAKEIVSDNGDYEIEFNFSEEWESYSQKTAYFVSSEIAIPPVIFEGNACEVPLVRGTNLICVGVGAGDMYTTTPCYIPVRTSIRSLSGGTKPPHADIYAQIMELYEEAVDTANSVRTDADNGVFNGKDGITPFISANGNWWIGEKDTGVKAIGENGAIFTPHIDENGILTWTNDKNLPNPEPQNIKGQTGEKGERGLQGERGLRGYSGMIPKIISSNTSGQIIVPVSSDFTIPELTADAEISLAEPTEEEKKYSVEWDFIITQGAIAYDIVLPDIYWGFGFAPTFSANSTTICRLYYLGNILCGEWVSK